MKRLILTAAAIATGYLAQPVTAQQETASAQDSPAASANADATNPLVSVTVFNFQNNFSNGCTRLPDNVNGDQFVLRFA